MHGTSETIRYATTDTSLGRLLVACTTRGVAVVSLGDDDATLLAELVRRFPHADIEIASPADECPAEKIAAGIEDPSAMPSDISVDLRGTPFQLEVWGALREIPPGSTISYRELAERVGRPTAVRAVAGACGANPVGLIVPCHRVIGADGSLTGFASGVDRKRALLEREGAL